jgi:DNA (cytosine-5)-methyltransferase 1
MKNGATAKEVAAGNPKFRLEAVTNWGKFEPAIRRWEEVLGRPAPAPTKPDGKDGAHRLSSAFTEWMMGVPEGWITDCGLTRNEELKACGNGVVPQQAEFALRILLAGHLLELEAGQELATLDPQTDRTSIGRGKSTAEDRQ